MFKINFSLTILFCCGLLWANTVTIDDIGSMIPDTVAKINGKNIDKKEFLTYFMANMPYQKIPKQMDKEHAQYTMSGILDKMVSEKIIDEVLIEKKNVVTEQDVIAFYKEKLAKLSPDELTLLKQRHKDIDQWITKQSQNKTIVKEFARYKFTEKEFLNNVKIDEGKVRAYYNSNSSRFNIAETVDMGVILLAYNPKTKGNKAAAKAKIEEIVAQLKAHPEKFEEIAKTQSQCPSKESGGRLGNIGKNMMHKKIETPVFALPKDGISEIIELNNSFNIFKSYGKTAQRRMSYDETKGMILEMLKSKEAETKLDAFLKDEFKKRNVELFIKTPPYKELDYDELKPEESSDEKK